MLVSGEGLLVSVNVYTNKNKDEVISSKVLVVNEDATDAELLYIGMAFNAEKYEELRNKIGSNVTIKGSFNRGYAKYDEIL